MTGLGWPILSWGIDVPLEGIPLLGQGIRVRLVGRPVVVSRLLGIPLVVADLT